jgi:iron complex transport system substrate-binding protein
MARSHTVTVFFALLALAPLPGCRAHAPASAPRPAAPSAGGFPLTLVDDAGRRVTLTKRPERIVSLCAADTEILFALGLDREIVGVDQYSDYPPAARSKPVMGSFAEPDLEQIVGSAPDLVLAAAMHVPEGVRALESRGITVAVIAPGNVPAVLDRIGTVGRLTGQERQAANLVASLRARIRAVAARIAGRPRPRVFVEVSPDLYTPGPGSFLNDVVARAGGENVAADAASEWPQISQEALLLKDPQVIVLTDSLEGVTVSKAAARPGWRDIDAVRRGRVVTIDPNLADRTGPRIADGLEAMADLIHPETKGLARR